jgi:hypothetical protein
VISRVLARWERRHNSTPFPSELDPLESANCGQLSKTQMVLDVQVCNAPNKRIPARSRQDAVCANAEQIELAADAIEVKIHLVFPLESLSGASTRGPRSRETRSLSIFRSMLGLYPSSHSRNYSAISSLASAETGREQSDWRTGHSAGIGVFPLGLVPTMAKLFGLYSPKTVRFGRLKQAGN